MADCTHLFSNCILQELGRAARLLHMIENDNEIQVFLYLKTKMKVPQYILYYINAYQTKLEKTVIESLESFFHKNFDQ